MTCVLDLNNLPTTSIIWTNERRLINFLVGDARLFYIIKSGIGFRQLNVGFQVFRAGAATMDSWPYVVCSFLRRYCTEEVPANAYDKVTRMSQKDAEPETEFADCTRDAALVCPDVFTEMSLIHNLVK